jgi:hypothetical protein
MSKVEEKPTSHVPRAHHGKRFLEKPQLGSEIDNLYTSIVHRTDVELKDIYVISIKPTKANKKFLYYNSDVAQLVVSTIAMTVVGEGMEIKTEYEDVETELDYLFKNFTVTKEGLKVNQWDLVKHIVEDNTLWSESVWVKQVVESPKHTINNGDEDPIARNVLSLVRLDPSSLKRVRDDFFGWVKWIQVVELPPTSPTNEWFGIDQNSLEKMNAKEREEFEAQKFAEMKERFYSDKYDPFMQLQSKDSGHVESQSSKTTQPRKIHIPDTKVVLFDIYNHAPFDTMVLDLLSLKRWLIFYVKKLNENFAGPIPIVTVGNVDSRPNDEEYNEILNDAADEAAKIRFGHSWAIPWDWKVEWQNPISSARSITADVEFIDKQIYNALGAPAALFEANRSNETENCRHT